LVEFPIARSAARARELLGRAAALDRTLHVEHIELLSPAQGVQRERAASLGRPKGGELRFSGTSADWIGDDALAGTPALRAVARLHRLVDLFGSARVAGAELERRDPGYRLSIDLEFADGGGTRLVEERGAELERATQWRIECERGALDDPPEPGTPIRGGGLFARDLDVFLDRIFDGTPSYVSDERVLHVLDLVGAIEALCSPA
jgi:biliverdin reductase